MDDTKPTVTNRSSWIAMTSDPAFDPIRASAVAHIDTLIRFTSRIWRAPLGHKDREPTGESPGYPRDPVQLRYGSGLPPPLYFATAKFHHITTPLRFRTDATDRAALEQADWLLPESTSMSLGHSHQLKQVIVRILEINATAAIPIIEFAVVEAPGSAAV
jgi:hypothetical protein